MIKNMTGLRRSIVFLIVSLTLTAMKTPAQTTTGSISGQVTDATGAAIAGAAITVNDTAKQQSRTAITDAEGLYRITNLQPGNYRVTAERDGFKKSEKSGYDLTADGRLTVNFTLETGTLTELVTIEAGGETINTTSGEVARVIDRSQIEDLALNARNYLQFATVLPGVPELRNDQIAAAADNNSSIPINGGRGSTNNLTIDGVNNLDAGGNASQLNKVSLDFIQEIKIQTSNFSAEHGRQSGAAINVTTRSGGNKYHGSAFETFRNDKLDARDILAPERTPLRFNNFGWSLGGPIKKQKLFFFAGMEWKLIRRFTDPVRRTLPTRADRNGDFSVRLRGNDGIVGTADDGVLKDPLSSLPCTAATSTRPAARDGCFGGNDPALRNKIPANRITPDGRAIAAIYDFAERSAVSYLDSPTGNNTIFQFPIPFDSRQETLRLDYRFNERHSIYGRYLHEHVDQIDPYGTQGDSNLPTNVQNRQVPGTNMTVGHTWIINQSLINEARVGASYGGPKVVPIGDQWKRDIWGFTFPQVFSGGRFDNGIPNVTIQGLAVFKGPANSIKGLTTDISFSDNLTIIRGAHSLKTGILLIRNRKDQNGRPPYTGDVTFNPSGNPRTTNQAFGDALLGLYRTYSEGADEPLGKYRFTQVEAFLSDSWKARRNLSLEIGGRFYWLKPVFAQGNNLTNFDPRYYDPAKAVRLNTDGSIIPNSGFLYNGLARAGSGITESERGITPNWNSPEVLSVPAGAPRGFYEPQAHFAPRFSFAYTPFSEGKTVIRGGFGIFYDRAEGAIIYSTINNPPYNRLAQFENGSLSAPGAVQGASAPNFGQITALDPNFKTMYTMSYSLTVQRELPRGIFFEAGYVANLGRHLTRQPDINFPDFEVYRKNQELPSASRPVVNYLRPYKGYGAIRQRMSDATSNYNSLQLHVTKRKGNVLFSGSYTWSKALADASSSSDDPENPLSRNFNYGPTTFDRRHIFVGTYTYRFPFFRNARGLAGGALGGWEVSGITRAQSGRYYSVTGATSIGSRRADYVSGETIALPREERSAEQWFNTDAFTTAPNHRRGSSGVGMVAGPGLYRWDISLRKNFRITERVKAQFQSDFFNAFNNSIFMTINTVVTDQAFGTVTDASPPRNIQFGLRVTF